MKKIFILRHSYASSAAEDIARPLSESGVKKCLQIKQILQAYSIDTVFFSDALRTEQTFNHIIDEPYGINIVQDNILYNGSSEDILSFIQKNTPENSKIILIIGHNPTISELANYFAKTCKNSAFHLLIQHGLEPGSLVLCESNINSWQELPTSKCESLYFW